MTRKKVTLAFKENDAPRKATFKKRKKGLLKKARELSILCDVEACVIINNPYDAEPEVWPSVPAAQRVISKFKKMPVMEQSKNMLDQESFTKQRIMKVVGQVNKLRESNKEKEVTEVMYRCLTGQRVQNLGLRDVNHLGMLLDQNMKEIGKRIEKLAKGEGSSKMAEVGSGKEVAPMKEQRASVDFGLETMQRPQGLGEMMMSLGDNSNGAWSNAFMF